MRDIFKYLSNLSNRGPKPNREAQLSGRFAKAHENPPAAPASFLGSILSADLDRSNPPAVAGMHAATDNVATAVIVVVVVVCVGIVSVIVAVGSEAEPYKRTSVKFAAVKSFSVKSSAVEATARETSMKAATAE